MLRSGDCEDMARDAHTAACSILALDVGPDTAPEVAALVWLASFYCPFLVESAIKTRSSGSRGFSANNVEVTDPQTGLTMSLHLYFKMIPWSRLLPSLRGQASPRYDYHRAECPLTPRVPSKQPNTEFRATVHANALSLPVLVVEPTDRCRTAWDCIDHIPHWRAVTSVVTSMQDPAVDARVRWLYTAREFAEERFYLYDMFVYSRVLTDLTSPDKVVWALVGPGDTYGTAPVGLCNSFPPQLRLVPGSVDLHPEALVQATRLETCLPRLPPLDPLPPAPPPRAAPSRRWARRHPICIRVGPDVAEDPTAWNEESATSLRRALETAGWEVAAEHRWALSETGEALLVWMLEARGRP